MGLRPGQNARAVASLTIASAGGVARLVGRERAAAARSAAAGCVKYSGETKVKRVAIAAAPPAGAAATFRDWMNIGFPPVTASSATRGSLDSASTRRGSSVVLLAADVDRVDAARLVPEIDRAE